MSLGKKHQHLLDFSGWSRVDIENMLETSTIMTQVLERPVKKIPALNGLSVCTAFFENSTRTRLSFELAARRMSADVVSFSAGTSSTKKGESLRDTITTLAAMRIDAFVVRHEAAGAAHRVAEWSGAHVINAGDGRRAHPTQALLDAYTLKTHFDQIEGLTVAIVGDIKHSRVARSNAELLPLLGANVRLCGPPTLQAPELAAPNVSITSNIREAVKDADVVMALRLQTERMSAGYLPSLEEYRALYQVNTAILRHAKPHHVVLHPGPMNRDVEIDDETADAANSLIIQQVANGLPVRMAVLYHLMVGKQ
jgi:aspartate carbamoyltransferase catalytic subunit